MYVFLLFALQITAGAMQHSIHFSKYLNPSILRKLRGKNLQFLHKRFPENSTHPYEISWHLYFDDALLYGLFGLFFQHALLCRFIFRNTQMIRTFCLPVSTFGCAVFHSNIALYPSCSRSVCDVRSVLWVYKRKQWKWKWKWTNRIFHIHGNVGWIWCALVLLQLVQLTAHK